jgi:hypothetical protein
MNFLRQIRYGKSVWVATAEATLEHVLKSGGVFHAWGHSWEIEEMGEWQNLERVFALLAQMRKHAVFTDNTSLSEAGTS